MTVFDSRLYSHSGRLRGCFIYALLCGDRSRLAVKIGHSLDPVGRLQQLKGDLEASPRTLAMLELVDKTEAARAEYLLHDRFRGHRIRDEWFAFTMADKEFFNRECSKVLVSFARPGWPLKWTRLPVAGFLAHQGLRRRVGL